MLDPNPDVDIKVYTVWFNSLGGDDRSRWPGDILVDPRVTEFWDEEKAAGAWFAEAYDFSHGPYAYDVYYLFAQDAEWNETPPELASTGYTVLGRRGRMADKLAELLAIERPKV